MNLLLFIIIFSLVVIPLGIFLRFLDLGVEKKNAVHLTLVFPFDIFRIHLSIYNHLKDKDKKAALKALVLPIIDLPQVIISYAEMHINMQAKILAIKELMIELNDKEIRKMVLQLREKGFIIKIKKKKVKQVDVGGDDLNYYLGNFDLGTTVLS
ncbi:hypothetical protein [Ectobacillus polymachus]|uniref:hypothetical protein n=1 Tax=Ectobacillus polymachus TaxID=1508806 RepID=UPI003A85CD44